MRKTICYRPSTQWVKLELSLRTNILFTVSTEAFLLIVQYWWSRSISIDTKFSFFSFPQILALACEESGGSMMWAGNDRGNIVSFRLDAGSGSLVKLSRMNGPGGPVTSLSWRSWLSKEAPWPTLLVNSACNAVSLYRVANRLGGLSLWRQYPIKHR